MWGSDSIAQYLFAVEIARILNCKNNGDVNCDCISCRWIYNNEHPEIKTVSKINSKPSGDETKNISVKQVGELLNETSKKSQDYRVFIFCDADYETLNQEQISYLEKYKELKNVISQKGDKYWIPKPLTSKVLQEESSNALLKTIEETPDRLTFIFLISSPNELISTIVSRSQLFYVQNSYNKVYDHSFFKEMFNTYPDIKRDGFFKFTKDSLNYISSKEINLIEYFENMQAYFTELLSVNYSNPVLKSKIIKTIENIIQAKKYKMSVIKDEYILDNFWVNIS